MVHIDLIKSLMNLLRLCLGICGLLYSCSQTLERQNIPLVGGIKIDSTCHIAKIANELDLGHQFGIEEWMFEIGFVMDSMRTKSNDIHASLNQIDTLTQILKEHSTLYSIAFNLENPRDYPKETVNIEHYLKRTSAFLAHMKNFPPNRIVLMGELINPAWTKGRINGFIEELRANSLENTSIVCAVFPYQLDDLEAINSADWFGIRYHEPPEEELRPFFLKTNRNLSKWLLQHGKKTMIVQTNLIGERKQELFMNQLRFWDEGIELKGVVLNSLYCTFSIRDTSSYFALGKEEHFLQYLRAYGD